VNATYCTAGVIATSKDKSVLLPALSDNQKGGLSAFLFSLKIAVLFFNYTPKPQIFKANKLTCSTPEKSNKMGLPESMKALRSVTPLSFELNNTGRAK
jgi:hypothetical protein